MIRRAFLIYGLMLIGFGRRVWAQVGGSSAKYSRLREPVRIPLARVATPFRLMPFTVEGTSPPRDHAPSRRVLLNGVLFRRAPGSSVEELSALCLTCPHEQCQVDLIVDQARLATIEGTPANPVFVCGCHESVFDARNEGAWLAGPAYRGLYRFRVTALTIDEVEIAEVETTALSEV